MAGNDGPFSTIESAQEFLLLLGDAIDEAIGDASREVSACAARHRQRQVEEWRLVLYKTTMLSSHVAQSRRLMGELLTLRNHLSRRGALLQADAAGADA